MNKKLNIALLSLHSCPWAKPGSRYVGGMNIYIREIAEQLAIKGHTVDIFTAATSCCKQIGLVQIKDNIRLIHLKVGEYNNIVDHNLDSYIIRATELIRSYRTSGATAYDLIHSHYWISGLTGVKLQNIWQIPHLTMFHTLGKVKNKLGLGNLEPEFRINNEQLIMNLCDKITALSAREKSELLKNYNTEDEKVAVIPCGINLQQFHPINKSIAREKCRLDSKKVALFVGRIDPLKGLDRLLKAISIMKDRTNFELVVIGGDGRESYEVELQSNFNNYDIQDKVDFRGSIPHEELHWYYNAADLCVIPSYYESFSLVALESLACGTPIIAADVGGIKDIAKRCALCCISEDNSPENLAANITQMLDSEEYVANTSLNIRKYLYYYSWSNITEMLIKEYYRTISSFNR